MCICARVHLCVAQLKPAVCHQIFFKEAFFILPRYTELILHNQFSGHFAHRIPTKVRDIRREKGYKVLKLISAF